MQIETFIRSEKECKQRPDIINLYFFYLLCAIKSAFVYIRVADKNKYIIHRFDDLEETYTQNKFLTRAHLTAAK